MAKETHKPGEKAKDSGQYPIVGPRGGDTGKERTVTKGEPFPPTPKKGQGYGTPDKTKHQIDYTGVLAPRTTKGKGAALLIRAIPAKAYLRVNPAYVGVNRPSLRNPSPSHQTLACFVTTAHCTIEAFVKW